jgi:PAS domain S-box-containing protein
MRILYVEDNRFDADLTRRALHKSAPHITLQVVESLREACAYLEQHAPGCDLVLLDLHLPDGDGLGLLAHIRQHHIPVAVVVITGTGDEETAVTTLKAGADDYIVKDGDYLYQLPTTLDMALQRFHRSEARFTRSVRILYAEDNPFDSEAVAQSLARSAPYIHLDRVDNVSVLFHRLLHASPTSTYDLLLLDFRLPGTNALEVLKQLHQMVQLDLPVVLLTAQGSEEVALQALKLGAADYIVKQAGYLAKLPWVLENAIHRFQLAHEQAALKKVNRDYKTLSLCNQVLVRSNDEPALFQEICRTLVATGNYPLVWIGIRAADSADNAPLSLAAQAGETCACMHEIMADDQDSPHSPALAGLRTGVPQIVHHRHDSPLYHTWHNAMLQRSYTRSIFLPIGIEGQSFGVLAIATRQDDAFNAQEVNLLSELADDLAYGIRSLRTRRERERAESELRVYRDHLEYLVTQRTQELRQSEEMLRALLNAIQETAFLVELDGTVLQANETAARRLGTTVAAMVGANAYTLLPPDMAAQRRPYIQQVIQTGQPVRFEDQRAGWYLDNTIYPVLDTAGNVTRLAIFALDQTERKQAEEALRESELRYRLLADYATDMISRHSPDGTYLYASPACATLLGYTPEELIGRNCYEFFHPKDCQLAQQVHSSVLQSQVVLSGSYRVRHKDGHYIWFETTGRTIQDARTGDMVEIITVSRDITRRKDAEEQIRLLNETLASRAAELENANAELEAFSHSVAHDLRSPLWSIDLMTEHLLDDHADQLNEEGRTYIQRIQTNTQRMVNVIEDLLKLSGATSSELQREPVHVSVLAHEIVADLRQRDPQRQVDITIAEGLVDEGDMRLLRIVLENLLSNAWKFTRHRAHATIEVGAIYREQQQGPVYFVRDNGAGFEVANAHKLFGAFQRLHSKTDFPGMGIGLATVRRIIQRHGGHVWAESEVGQGATFYFTLQDGRAKEGPAPQGSQSRLEEQERLAIGRKLTEIIAHEVNTPLQTILFSLELMSDASEEERDLFVQRTRQQIARIGAILHQLKDMYQAADGEHALVDMRALLEHVLLLIGGRLDEQAIVVERDLAADVQPVWGVADQLKQVLLNILLHAIEAMPGGGLLAVRCWQTLQPDDSAPPQRPTVCIEVCDSGADRTSDGQEYRVSPFFATHSDSTGLGLFVALKIINQHGGTMTVKRPSGAGTCCLVALPVVRDGTYQ